MTWMATATLAAGAIGAGASAYGASEASQAAGAGNALAAGSAGMTSAEARRQAQLQAPYTSIGYAAAPLYQWLTTGVRPELNWSPEDASRLGALEEQERELTRMYDLWTGPGSMRSNHRNVRYAQQMALDIKRQLDELQDLRTRRQQYQAMGQYSDPNALIQQSPMYQWQQKQGEKAINRAAAARGMWNSSASMGQLNQFNESLAANERNRVIGDLYNAINIGRGASQTVGNYGTGAASENALAMRNYGAGLTASGQQTGMNYASLGAIPMNALSTYQNYRTNNPGWQTSGSGAVMGQYNPAYNGGMTPEQYRTAHGITYME